MGIIKGVDVYVGDGNIEWEKVKKDGIKFAMIKASQGYLVSNPKSGMITDSSFSYNITNADKNGIVCGAYHYLMAKTIKEAKEEAEYFVSVISRYRSNIKLYAGVDMENDKAKSYNKTEKKLNTDILIAFCEVVKSNGYNPIIYINPNFIKNYLEFDRLSEYNIWLAFWTTRDKMLEYINSFSDTSQFKIWQSGSTTVNGIKGSTDGDELLHDLTEEKYKLIIGDFYDYDNAVTIKNEIVKQGYYCTIIKVVY